MVSTFGCGATSGDGCGLQKQPGVMRVMRGIFTLNRGSLGCILKKQKVHQKLLFIFRKTKAGLIIETLKIRMSEVINLESILMYVVPRI